MSDVFLEAIAQYNLSAAMIAAMFGAFLLAGLIKGATGLGMAAVSVALLTVLMDLATAIAIVIVPTLLTNVWQACVGGHATALIARLWRFYLPATATIFLGALVLAHANLVWLAIFLGLVLTLYGILNLCGLRLSIGQAQEHSAALAFGATNGVLTGMTGCLSVPGVFFLQAIGMPREAFVQAMGILFTVSSIGLAVSLWELDLVTMDHVVVSTAALVPTFIGMVAGQSIRGKLSDVTFRQTFFITMLLTGLYIAASKSVALGG
jgi:uncharacterized membrane protein YfcA